MMVYAGHWYQNDHGNLGWYHLQPFASAGANHGKMCLGCGGLMMVDGLIDGLMIGDMKTCCLNMN